MRTKKWTVYFAVFTATGISGLQVAFGSIVGVDSSHYFDSTASLASGSDYDSFRAAISGLGNAIEPTHSFNAADLEGLDALIVKDNYFQNHRPYSLSEMTAIQSFANQKQCAVFVGDSSIFADPNSGSQYPINFGDNLRLLENIISYITTCHGVLFIGDAGGGFDYQNYNALTVPFNVGYASQPSETRTITGFFPHPLTQGVSTIGVTYYLPLTIDSPSLDLTYGDGQDNVLAVLIPEPGSSVSMTCVFALFASGMRKKNH